MEGGIRLTLDLNTTLVGMAILEEDRLENRVAY